MAYAACVGRGAVVYHVIIGYDISAAHFFVELIYHTRSAGSSNIGSSPFILCIIDRPYLDSRQKRLACRRLRITAQRKTLSQKVHIASLKALFDSLFIQALHVYRAVCAVFAIESVLAVKTVLPIDSFKRFKPFFKRTFKALLHCKVIRRLSVFAVASNE